MHITAVAGDRAEHLVGLRHAVADDLRDRVRDDRLRRRDSPGLELSELVARRIEPDRHLDGGQRWVRTHLAVEPTVVGRLRTQDRTGRDGRGVAAEYHRELVARDGQALGRLG